jgi:O-antigen/teichoic acid export membrane protein
VLFAALAAGAPAYAAWQGHPVVGWMLIAYGGKLIWQNLYFIPSSMMRRELRYKELSLIRICANVAEFLGKIISAALGLRIWCFVIGPLARVFVTGIGIQLRHPWRPSFTFRFREARAYFTFGLSTSAHQILFHLYTSADYPIVNKLFGATALGLYRAAYELVLEPVRVVALVFTDIAFPTFARLRHRRAQLVEQFLDFTRQNLVVIVPFVAVVVVAAEQALAVAWGPDFKVAAATARVLCLVGLLRALSYVVPPLLDGLGYPFLTLVYTAVAAVVMPSLFVGCGLWLGPELGYTAVAIGWAIGYPIAFGVLLALALRRIGLSAITYLRRVGGIPLCAAIAAVIGAGIHPLTDGWPAAPRLVIVVVVIVGALGVLLARFVGISPRSAMRALSAKGPPEPTEEPRV